MGDTHHNQEGGEGRKPRALARVFSAERLAVALLAGGFELLGWLTLWQGGMSVKGQSGLVTFIDGRPGRVVAALCFCAAAISLLLFLRSFKAGRLVNMLALALLLIPPMFYMMARH